jgi:DNA polymerase-3 subunit delta'
MSSVWNKIVGQHKAVERLQQLAINNVHAFLFIGPEGCGKEDAARAFASVLITGSDNENSRESDLITRGAFADVVEVLREGAAVDKDEAEEIIRLASTTPTESNVKVVIIHEVHLMRDSAAARLLKTIEEPSEKVIFILLADQLVPSLATINSRCVVVNFMRLTNEIISETLCNEGVEQGVAIAAAHVAAGNLPRARLLAADERLSHRQEAFASVPYRLDGAGSTVANIVDELVDRIDEASAPLVEQQALELKDLEARVSLTGERGSGRKALQDRHKRQLRKFNTDELRSGLATVAATYHAQIIAQPPHPDADKYMDAVHRIHKTMGSLGLNVNEKLALQALFLQCPSLMMLARLAPVN